MHVVGPTERSGVLAQPTIARCDDDIDIVLSKSLREALSNVSDVIQDLFPLLNGVPKSQAELQDSLIRVF